VTSAHSHDDPSAAERPAARTGVLPRLGTRERARAVGRFPKPIPGRHLAIADGDDVVLVAVDRPVLHLGRSPSADIVIDHTTVSRRHAILSEEEEGTVLLDDRSANGVVLNGERVSRAVLRDGDQILLGEVALRYVEVPEAR
jgi:pSer/pThr/pTyr-binding forkhead associated (FHA) protein